MKLLLPIQSDEGIKSPINRTISSGNFMLYDTEHRGYAYFDREKILNKFTYLSEFLFMLEIDAVILKDSYEVPEDLINQINCSIYTSPYATAQKTVQAFNKGALRRIYPASEQEALPGKGFNSPLLKYEQEVHV